MYNLMSLSSCHFCSFSFKIFKVNKSLFRIHHVMVSPILIKLVLFILPYSIFKDFILLFSNYLYFYNCLYPFFFLFFLFLHLRPPLSILYLFRGLLRLYLAFYIPKAFSDHMSQALKDQTYQMGRVSCI